MSSNNIEKDYKDFETCIEQMAEEELKKIRKKTSEIRNQAEKVGEAVEASMSASDKKKG